VFEPGAPAYALLDHDRKTMPDDVARKMDAAGGFWAAIVSVAPGLAGAARVTRQSTSAGLSRRDTRETFPSSGGLHVYVEVEDGADIERFLVALHDRCWLAGYGWKVVGVAGQLLDRTIVDVMVGKPERLVFEGAPVVEPPLYQDAAVRRPVATAGVAVDTTAICPPLTAAEKTELERLRARATVELRPGVARAREAYIAGRTDEIAKRTGLARDAARKVAEKQAGGVLLPSVQLEFDDDDLAGKTVGDVLDDPAAFDGETLADPLEGIEYGRCKAKVMIGDDGAPWINSFAHGRTTYDLKYDAAAIRAKISASTRAGADLVDFFVGLILRGDVSDAELPGLVSDVSDRARVGVRAVNAAVKAARADQARRRAEAARQRRRANQHDPRPELPVPARDAPLAEETAKLNDVISREPIERQLRRSIDGYAVKARLQKVPRTRAFSSAGDGKEEDAPEQWTIAALDEYALTEEIERHVNYVDDDGRSVRPPMAIVKAYTRRDDDALRVLAAIATQPVVLADGEVIGRESGFDAERGIEFVISPSVAAAVPRREEATDEAVATAMDFLTDEWLVDVATTYAGKCVVVAGALTLMERSLLPDRPTITARSGRRGAGKGTTMKMMITAVIGIPPAAATWSVNEDERRKAIFAYFRAGVPYILWDNIPRGLQLSCPHIERSCTTEYYYDRILGVSEAVATAAATIHLFTGNNIGAKGDLASRNLTIELAVDKPDPENRPFAHHDPIGWTEKNRGAILRALYTILLGNPTLDAPADADMRTRFKMWWRLVGSAVERAAALAVERAAAQAQGAAVPKPKERVDFQALFRGEEDVSDDEGSLADVLYAMAKKWPEAERFTSFDVATIINNEFSSSLHHDLRGFLFPKLRGDESTTVEKVAHALKFHVGNVVSHAAEEDGAIVNRTLVLRAEPREAGRRHVAKQFYVEAKPVVRKPAATTATPPPA
jgi:hypothetical protein